MYGHLSDEKFGKTNEIGIQHLKFARSWGSGNIVESLGDLVMQTGEHYQ